jgi:adenylyltransferase/sulfurtransferase
VKGQERLASARVLLVGAGGLGSPAALYLAAAGVGTLAVVDGDAVELSNLQRQILHGNDDVGRPKVDSALDRLQDVNPLVHVRTIPERLHAGNATGLISDVDLVIDGSDNFPTRYLINDACVFAGRPYVYGAILRFEGQVSVFGAEGGPCYRCLFHEPPPPDLVPSCADAGVLGVLPGIIGSLQALEAVKLLLGIGDPLVGRLLLFDGIGATFREIGLRRDPDCPVCGDHPTVTELIDYEAFCGVEPTAHAFDVGVRDFAEEWRGGGVQLVDVREAGELAVSSIEGAMHIPLGELPRRLGELESARPIVVVCHTGVRSARATEMLRAAGFARARNLAGGIDAWSREVDPTVPRY